MITLISRHPAAFVQHQQQSTSTMGRSPAIPAGYTFSNSFNVSSNYLLFHLLLLLQVTFFKLFQVFIWLFSAGPFSEEGFPNKSGGVATQHQYDFYPITECEQCALGAYLGQGVARLLSRTGQTANSADIRCGIQFAKAM